MKRRTRSKSRGFTLMEILLTLATGAVLLAALWSLMGTYIRLFDAGRTKAGSTQLISGVMRQLQEDLRGAIQDISDPLPGSTGPVRRFGLFGDSHTLQIDLLQTAWPRGPAQFTGGASTYGPELPLAPQADEIRTVRYSFIDSTASEQSGGESKAGLVRWEIDYESPYPGEGLSGPTGAASSAASPSEPGQEASPGELSLLGLIQPDPNDDSLTLVPEVVATSFRYYDGTTWTDTWNSLERRSLPVAIEVTLDFQTLDQPPTPPPVAQGSDEVTEPDLFTPDGLPVLPPGVVSCRLVVDLPMSYLREPPAVAELSAAAALDPTMEPDDVGPGADEQEERERMGDMPLPDDFFGRQNQEQDQNNGFRPPLGRRFQRRAQARQQSEAAAPPVPAQWMRLGP